jgi:hypothetical protein
MPVIGRLDKQVNDVLIDPVGKRRRDVDEDARVPSDTRRAPTGEDERRVAPDMGDEKGRPRAGRGGERGREDEQLPVWLL